MKGWKYDNYRHSLSARGISTKRFSFARSKREILDEQIKLELDVMEGRIVDEEYAKRYKELEEEKRKALAAKQMSEPVKIVDIVVPDPQLHNDAKEEEVVESLRKDDPLDAMRMGSLAEGEVLGEEIYDLTGPGMIDFYYGRRLPLDGSRRSMAYVPTYVAGDISAMGADAIGIAGASVVGWIPLVVGAGVVYGGAKHIKGDIDKNKKRTNK